MRQATAIHPPTLTYFHTRRVLSHTRLRNSLPHTLPPPFYNLFFFFSISRSFVLSVAPKIINTVPSKALFPPTVISRQRKQSVADALIELEQLSCGRKTLFLSPRLLVSVDLSEYSQPASS